MLKNIVKLSLTRLAFRNIDLQHQRVLNKRISVSLSFSAIFKGEIPLLGSVESTVDDAEGFDKTKDVSLSYYSVTPKVRFYLGKKGFGKGFYHAPFYRNSKLTLDGVSFDYPTDEGGTSSISTSGSINGNTIGLLIASPFTLGKSVVLDWWIVGPHYGSGSREQRKNPHRNSKKLQELPPKNILCCLILPHEIIFELQKTNDSKRMFFHS